MSIEAASESLNKAKQDSKLQRQLDDCLAQEDGLQSFIEIAAQHGCEFTTEEFAELIQPADGALSDDQLDQVAGGFGFLSSFALRFRQFNLGPKALNIGRPGGGIMMEEEEELQL